MFVILRCLLFAGNVLYMKQLRAFSKCLGCGNRDLRPSISARSPRKGTLKALVRGLMWGLNRAAHVGFRSLSQHTWFADSRGALYPDAMFSCLLREKMQQQTSPSAIWGLSSVAYSKTAGARPGFVTLLLEILFPCVTPFLVWIRTNYRPSKKTKTDPAEN